MAEEKTVESLEAQLAEALNNLSKMKSAVDAATKDASKWKHSYEDVNGQLSARLTEEERAAAERAAKEKEKDELIASLQKEKTVSSHKAKYLALGYDAESAGKAAQALADNDFETVFEVHNAFNAAQKAAFEAEALGKQPKTSTGETPKGTNYSEMSDEDYYREVLGKK